MQGLSLLAAAASEMEPVAFNKEEEAAIEFHLQTAREVANLVGVGRVERVYHNAINLVLSESGVSFESEEQYAIKYTSPRTQLVHVLANERVDIRTFGCAVPFILELKAVAKIDDGCYIQLIHYMVHFDYRFGAVINFGTKNWQMMVVHRSAADGKFYLYDPLTRAVLSAPRHSYF